jgi:hypothetical protein
VSVFGRYGAGGRPMPRVLRLTVRREGASPPAGAAPLRFACDIHEEGTGLSWTYSATLSRRAEAALVAQAAVLHEASAHRSVGAAAARRAAQTLGRQLDRTFLGRRGREYLSRARPTALLLEIDERVLSLPWELLGREEPWSQRVPVGRVVRTATVPHPERDPLAQDSDVRILAVVDPTADLVVARHELDALKAIAGHRAGGYRLHLDLLEGAGATRAALRRRLRDGDYDVLHFAGHAAFAARRSGASVLRLADGPLTADEVLTLEWPAPPGIVFASACESARLRADARLVGRGRAANGIAAAFLSAGVAGYVGYQWPVSDVGAGLVAETFYGTLFERENVGVAILEARRRAVHELAAGGDLAGHSVVLYGDAGSEHRRDLAMAV